MSNNICVQYICNIKGSSLFYFFYFLTYYIYLKNPSFSNKKSPSANAKGLEIVKLPQQNDFRTFCMNDETEKVCQKLEEVVS